ncbi:MAG: hypothetical protein WBX15_04660 [Thermoanaerobaculia bacterium]
MKASFVAIAVLAVGIAAVAPGVRIQRMREIPFPVARVVAGPSGTLACLDWITHTIRVVDFGGEEAKIDVAVPASAQITNIGGGDGQAVITTARHGTFVLDANGSVRARFAANRFSPYVAATVDRNTAFGMGSAGDATGKIHAEWLVTRVDLEAPSNEPKELVTDSAFADPFARSLYPLGYILLSSDGKTLYALWEGSSILHVIPTRGSAPHAITVTSGDDAPPLATPALRASAMADRDAFYRLRSTYRWPQGLLRGPGESIAILFREPASRGNGFTLDLYSPGGKSIASHLAVAIEPRTLTAHARAVVATDGRQYILVNEPKADYSGAKHQALYAIEILR